MPVAIVIIAIGGLMIYSSLKGVSIADAFSGAVGGPLDPAGGKGGRTDTNSPTSSLAGATAPGYPLPVPGTDLGGVAAHKARPFGNWQSDNAVDIGVPMGTTVLAVADGTITKLGGHWDGTGQSNPNGYNITLKTADNTWFYTHLRARDSSLRVGSQVSKGQALGESGAANNVAHLHIASQNGDPEQLLGVH